MLNIQLNWLILLTVNFLALIFILNIILYKPVLKIFEERDNTVKGSLDAAKEMERRKEEGIERMNKEIAASRAKAREVFDSMRSEGLEMQKTFLSEAEESSAAMIQTAREELKGEVSRARQALRADVERFSEEIVRKLVGA
ncbi:MAG: ATP synthase F0 subunit B [Candidatus Sulfobium sp.]